jgi:hypothetical protein
MLFADTDAAQAFANIALATFWEKYQRRSVWFVFHKVLMKTILPWHPSG